MPDEPAIGKSVFLNVPYDKEYAPLFTALIAGLVALGRIPRCALEAQSDPIIHGGTTEGILGGLLDCFDSPGGAPPLRRLVSMARRLALVAAKAQRDFRRDEPFKRAIFLQLCEAAVTEATRRRLIAE